eukprot:Rmarinus@m.22461
MRDSYGFPVPESCIPWYESSRKHLRVLEEKVQNKWKDLVEFNDMGTISLKARENIVELINEAPIPSKYRSLVWPGLGGVRLKMDRGVSFHELVHEGDVRRFALDMEQVEKDLHRTFPEHTAFDGSTDEGRAGLQKLRNILCAYVRLYPATGYVQSMNYIAGFLLVHVPDEETAFWLFVTVLEEMLPRQYYMDRLTEHQVNLLVIEDLVLENLPELHRHLNELDVPVGLAVSEWLLALFCTVLPTQTTSFLWDMLFVEGYAAILKHALALLKVAEEDLYSCDECHDALAVLKNVGTYHSAYDPLALRDVSKSFRSVTPIWVKRLQMFHRRQLRSGETPVLWSSLDHRSSPLSSMMTPDLAMRSEVALLERKIREKVVDVQNTQKVLRTAACRIKGLERERARLRKELQEEKQQVRRLVDDVHARDAQCAMLMQLLSIEKARAMPSSAVSDDDHDFSPSDDDYIGRTEITSTSYYSPRRKPREARRRIKENKERAFRKRSFSCTSSEADDSDAAFRTHFGLEVKIPYDSDSQGDDHADDLSTLASSCGTIERPASFAVSLDGGGDISDASTPGPHPLPPSLEALAQATSEANYSDDDDKLELQSRSQLWRRRLSKTTASKPTSAGPAAADEDGISGVLRALIRRTTSLSGYQGGADGQGPGEHADGGGRPEATGSNRRHRRSGDTICSSPLKTEEINIVHKLSATPGLAAAPTSNKNSEETLLQNPRTASTNAAANTSPAETSTTTPPATTTPPSTSSATEVFLGIFRRRSSATAKTSSPAINGTPHSTENLSMSSSSNSPALEEEVRRSGSLGSSTWIAGASFPDMFGRPRSRSVDHAPTPRAAVEVSSRAGTGMSASRAERDSPLSNPGEVAEAPEGETPGHRRQGSRGVIFTKDSIYYSESD